MLRTLLIVVAFLISSSLQLMSKTYYFQSIDTRTREVSTPDSVRIINPRLQIDTIVHTDFIELETLTKVDDDPFEKEPYYLTIENNNIKVSSESDFNIQLVDASGRSILNSKAFSGNSSFEIPQVSDGCYFLLISNGNHSESYMLMNISCQFYLSGGNSRDIRATSKFGNGIQEYEGFTFIANKISYYPVTLIDTDADESGVLKFEMEDKFPGTDLSITRVYMEYVTTTSSPNIEFSKAFEIDIPPKNILFHYLHTGEDYFIYRKEEFSSSGSSGGYNTVNGFDMSLSKTNIADTLKVFFSNKTTSPPSDYYGSSRGFILRNIVFEDKGNYLIFDFEGDFENHFIAISHTTFNNWNGSRTTNYYASQFKKFKIIIYK